MEKDLHNNVRALAVVSPIAIGTNGTQSGKIIDRAGYGGVEFIAAYGAVTTTGTAVTLVMLEGDVTGTMTSVADADILGTELLASLTATTPRTSGVSKNVSKRVGYKGSKRYVTVNAISTGGAATSAGHVSLTAVLFNPTIAATPNP